MIQDIAPHKYHLEYSLKEPGDRDIILVYKRNMVLIREGDELQLPYKKELEQALVLSEEAAYVFLFSIDETGFYLLESGFEPDPLPGYVFLSPMFLRTSRPLMLSYAAATGYHLSTWYRNNVYCGRCGHKLIHDPKERMQRCPDCNNVVYPRINPSVIIGVRDRMKDRLLVTQYNPNHISDPNQPNARREQARRPGNHYALVAGYIEIGESGEMCVEREVFEEVGLKVKNIRYYASQPWAFSSSFLVGYICDLDGDDTLHIQEDELSRAVWKTREEMEDRSADYSLTSAIMEAFRKGEI